MKFITLQSLAITCLTLVSTISFAQNVGINTTGATPNAAAILDLNTGNTGTMGFLPEQVALTANNVAGPITLPPTGLLVYNTATAGVAPHNVVPGYYYNSGTPAAPSWAQFVIAGTDWFTTGNTGTVDGVNFLGTIDNIPLTFRVNNQKSGRIDNVQANTFFGYNSGGAVTSQNNTAMGSGALQLNATGSYNAAVGSAALNQNNSGIRNTACGSEAMELNTSGSDNAAFGYAALFSNSNAINNTACGYASLQSNTTGGNNTATGASALTNNVTANDNTADGNQALYLNTYASQNTAMGSGSLQNQAFVNGNVAFNANNTAIGYRTLFANNPTTNANGIQNTAVGASALSANTNGTGNTALGYQALLANTTGSNNTAVGFNANVGAVGLSNAMALGNGVTVTASNSTEIGNVNVVFCGINGAVNTAGEALVVGTNLAPNGDAAFCSSGGAWTNASDRNKKENITPLNSADILNKVCSLPLFRWNYKVEPTSVQHIGPMAQDFYKLFNVGNDSLSIATIDPAGVALVAIQELNKKLEKQNKSLQEQVNDVKSMNAALLKRIEALEKRK